MSSTYAVLSLPLGPVCAFMSSVTWAVGSANYAKLSRTNSPFAVNFARGLMALPLFVLATFLVEGGWQGGFEAYRQLRLSHVGWFTLSMVASYGLGDVLFLWSTQSLGVPGALAIASAYPVWTALAGVTFRGESLGLLQGLGLGLTVAGVIVVILNAPKRPIKEGTSKAAALQTQGQSLTQTQTEVASPGSSPKFGVALALLTSGMWAINSFAVAQGGVDVSPFVGNTARMLLALVLSASFGALLAPRASLWLPCKDYGRYFWLFAFEAFGGSAFYMYGLAHSSLVFGPVLASLAPVLAVPAAWLLRLEKMSIYRTLGVGLVVCGLWILMTGGVWVRAKNTKNPVPLHSVDQIGTLIRFICEKSISFRI